MTLISRILHQCSCHLMPSYSHWHTCSTGSSRVHKRQVWAVYSKFACFTLLSKVLAWRLLPRWPPACLARRDVPRMSRERVRRSKWEEHPFVPPPHAPVMIRTIKQTFNWFCIKLPSPSLIPLQPRLCFSLFSMCIHHCMFTSFRTSSSVQFTVFPVAQAWCHPSMVDPLESLDWQVLRFNQVRVTTQCLCQQMNTCPLRTEVGMKTHTFS